MTSAVLHLSYDENVEGDLIINELSIICVQTGASSHYFIKFPVYYPTNEWNFKGCIRSSIGEDYCNLRSLIHEGLKNMRFIFVRNEKILSYIKKYIDVNMQVFNLDNFKCPQTELLPNHYGSECLKHSNELSKEKCSHYQAFAMADWIFANYDKTCIFESKVRLNTFQSWDDKYDVKKISQAGFISDDYLLHNVRCIYCNHRIYNINENTNVILEHKKISTDCQLYKIHELFSDVTGY